jgi:hypothetical protein
MSFKDMPKGAAAALSDLGIYIFDPEGFGGLSYSQAVGNLLCEPSPQGVLYALAVACGDVDPFLPSSLQNSNKISVSSTARDQSGQVGIGSSRRALLARKKMLSWPATVRRSLREFILDSLLGKLTAAGLSPRDRVVLCRLPIWEQHGHSGAVPESKEDLMPFCAIQTDPTAPSSDGLSVLVKLPPKGVDTALLGPGFLRIRGDRDRSFYSQLGVVEPMKGAFFAENILPQIFSGEFDGGMADTLAVELLRSLPQVRKTYSLLLAIVEHMYCA